MLFQLIHLYCGIAVPVGNNVLSKMVQGICSGAGLGGRKADHSLCVSSASILVTPSPYSGNDLVNYKSMDCYINFLSGWVREILVRSPSDCSHL
jgi:hypothetical protein